MPNTRQYKTIQDMIRQHKNKYDNIRQDITINDNTIQTDIQHDKYKTIQYKTIRNNTR